MDRNGVFVAAPVFRDVRVGSKPNLLVRCRELAARIYHPSKYPKASSIA